MPARLTLITRHSPLKAKRGFALLITITLLAFLVILLVGLATYTRIETAISGNTQRQGQARDNALAAMNIALGQLQKYGGPDKRATATAEANGGGTNPHWTGIWDSDPATTAPLSWLVSGNEKNPLAVLPSAAVATGSRIELVGAKSAGTANSVVAPLQTITAPGVPGQTVGTSATIGRYAWWVGDQGVKAPVAVSDNSAAITYVPYETDEKRARIRQQIGLGAGAADSTGAPAFEPHDANNTPLIQNDKIAATNQLAFLKNSGNTALGLARVQQNFHAWSPNNYAVLANTKLGGLRQDLSLKPDLLGTAFASWANYTNYMEDPANAVNSGTPPLPIFSTDPIRRRYAITPALFSSDTGIAPVLTYFYVLVGVRKETGAPYTVSLRWAAALWNPYSSALVPEDLRLEISGLRRITPMYKDSLTGLMVDDATTISLRQLYGNPLIVSLPWTPSSTPTSEESSWLPGRVYNWTFLPGVARPPIGGVAAGRFNSRDLGGFADGLTSPVTTFAPINNSTQLALRVAFPAQLVIRLKRANGDLLGTYTSPLYDAVATTEPGDANNFTSQLGYLFRFAESVDTAATPGTWLMTAGRDPRDGQIPPTSLVAVPFGTDPSAYKNFVRIRAPGRLLDRDISSGDSYNEDVPLFELPRAPLLSLGQLQHFYLSGAQPFAIGNQWGAGLQINSVPVPELFDRHFFSGLVTGIAPEVTNGALVLPNPSLKVFLRKADGSPVTADDLRPDPANGTETAKYTLQSGAFNLNSSNIAAWSAVLRSARFPAPKSFTYLDADAATGTAALDGETTASVQSSDAQFFRFPQSAQEIFKADDGYVQSTTSSGEEQSVINTPLFRRGMRTLTPAQVTALAGKIVEFIQAHATASGPFRTLEDFLSSSAVFGSPPANEGDPVVPRSLLEAAIADAKLNDSIAEFSSQWLAQADVMTALAPFLFPRSDTFMIRSYGEAVNPTTSATEGKAWCEAIVQRVPEYFDPADPSETALADFDTPVDPTDPASTPSSAHQLNKLLGRRFKVVSFRWLTRSDI